MVSVLNKEDVNLGNPKNESKSVNPSLVTQDLPPYLEAINESNKMKNDLKVNISIRETPMWLKLSPTTSNDSSNGEIKNEEILKHICKLRKDIEETDTLILILLVVIALLLWSCIIHFNNHNHFNLNLSLLDKDYDLSCIISYYKSTGNLGKVGIVQCLRNTHKST